jgi:hypothetical protein
MKPCKSCVDPSYCVSIIKECEIEALDKLEDEKQSQAFYETYIDNDQHETADNVN